MAQQRHACCETHLLERAITSVMEQKVRQVVVGDKNIGEAVAIVIGERHTHAAPAELCDARFLGNIFERPVSAIAVQLIGHALKVFWMAVDAQIPGSIAAILVECGRPLGVVHNKQIE